MKFALLLLLFFVPGPSFSQSSLTEVYNNRKFPCDSESGSYSINMCSGAKAEFADSLMNKLYRRIIKSFDKEIAVNNSEALRKSKKLTANDSTDMQFALKQKDYYMRMKQSIISSQKQWLKLRTENSNVEAVMCEGGTGCVGMVNEAWINDTLDRIRKLESFGFTD